MKIILGVALNSITREHPTGEVLRHQVYVSKSVSRAVSMRVWGPQVSLCWMLSCLTAWYLDGLQQPRTGTAALCGWASVLDSILTAKTQRPGATIQNQWREEFNCITACPLGDYGEKRITIFLSHFLCMCLSHYFIFSLWIQSGQQNSDWNVVLATSEGHSQILCCLSLSSQMLTQLSLRFFFTSVILQKHCGFHINLGICSMFITLMMGDGMTWQCCE